MVNLLKKAIPNNRLRVKEVQLPVATSDILGEGIDVTILPEGHFACNGCKGYKFECSIIADLHRLEAGCMSCGKGYRFLFPLDCPLPPAPGRFTCFKHPTKGMIVISNSGKLSVGCENCWTQVIFTTKTETNIIIPEKVH